MLSDKDTDNDGLQRSKRRLKQSESESKVVKVSTKKKMTVKSEDVSGALKYVKL